MGYSKNVWKCWLCSEWNSSALLDAYCIIYCWLHTIFLHNVKQCVICNGNIWKDILKKRILCIEYLPKCALYNCYPVVCLTWLSIYNVMNEQEVISVFFLTHLFSFILSAKVRASWIFFSSGIENEFNNCLYTWVTASSHLIQLVRYYSISLKHNFSGLTFWKSIK